MEMEESDEGNAHSSENLDDTSYLDSLPKSSLITSDMSLEILELFDNSFGRASPRNGFYPGISTTEGVNLKEPLNNLLRTQECEPLIGDTWQENGSDLDSHGKIGMFSTDEDTRSSQLNVSISDSDTDWTSPLFNIANESSSVDIVTNALEDLDMDHSNPVDPCTQMPIPQEVKHGNMLNGNLLNDSQSSMETTLPEDSSMDLNTSHGSMDSELTEVNGSTDYSSDKLEDTELQIVEEPVVTRDSASTEQAFFKSNVSTPRSQDSMNNNSNNIYNSNHILSERDSTDFDDEDDDADGACSSKSRNSGYIEFKVEEILESERSYVKDLDDIVEGYLLAILDRPTLPLKPEDYQALFSNLESIRDFNKEFLKDLEDCDHDPVLIAECFLEKEEDFIMYSQYCTNYPSAVKVLTKCLHQPVMCKFFQDAQNKLGHALPLGAYLLKPVQRILKYHLLFHDLCKHINTDDEIYDTLEEALDAMKEVAKQINHMKAQSDKVLHVQQIQSQLLDQDRDLSTYGELLLEDVMRLQGSRGDRNVYLFEKAFFIAKRREDGYISIKTEIKCSNLLLMENIPKETFGFTVMPFDNRDEQHILVAKGLEQKHQWTHQIKKMILENFKGLIPSKAKDIVLNNQSGSSAKDGEKDTSTKEQPVKLRKRKPRSKQRRRRRHSDPPSQLRRGTVQVKGMKKPDVAKLMTNKRASSLVRSEGICSTEESMSESESSNSPNRLSTVQVNDKDDTTEMSQVETNNHQNQNIDLPKDEQTDDDLDEHNDQPLPEPEAIEETCPNMKNNVEELKMEEHDEDSPDELDILETLHDTIENIIQEEGVKMGNKKETSPFQLRSNIKDLKPKKAESIELDSEDVWIKRPIIRGVRVSGDRPLDRPLSADILTNSSHSRRSLSRSVSSGYQTLPKVMKAQSDPNFLSTKIKSEPVLNKTGEGNMSESNSSIMSSGLDQTCSSHESILESFEDSIEYGLCASGDAHQLQSSNDDFAKETIKNNEPVQVKESPRSKDSDCKSKVSTQTDSGKSLHKTISADISAISRNMRLSKVFKMARDYSQRVKRTSRPAVASLFNSDNDQSNDKPTTEVMHNKTDNGSSFVKSNKASPTYYHEEEVPVFDPTVPSIVEGKETAQEEKTSAIKVESRLLGVSQTEETERKSREIYRTSAIKRSKSAETISNAKLSLRIFEDAPDEPVGDFKRGPSIKDRLRSIKEKTTYQKKNEIKDLPQKFKSLKERQKDLEKCVTKPIPKTNKEVEKLIATNIEAASEDDEVDSKITKLTRHSSCSSVSSIQLTPSNESRHRSWSSRSSGLDQEDVVFRSVKQRQLLLQMAYSKPVPKTVNVSAEINTEIPKSSWRLSDNSR